MKKMIDNIKSGMVRVYEYGISICYKNVDKIQVINMNGQLLGYMLCFEDGANLFLSKDVKFEAFCSIDITPYKSDFIHAPK